MATIATSKVTAQGQISVPSEVRRKLGVRPGSILEWDEEDGRMVVRRAGRFTFEDIHREVFRGQKPKRRTVKEMKEAIGSYIRERHGRS